MKNYSFEKEISKVKESIRICKYNIQNQEKKLIELNKKISAVQTNISDINSLNSSEHEKLTSINNQLIDSSNLQEKLILEFQETLNFYEKKLHELESNSIRDLTGTSYE